MPNPYEAPNASVADPQRVVTARPTAVSVGLAILWFVLIGWAMGTFRQLRGIGSWQDLNDAWSAGYATYLVGMCVVPAWLFVMTGFARHWARVAAVILQGLDFCWRLYLFIEVEHAPHSELVNLLTTPVAQLFAYLMLFSPRANDWFRTNREMGTFTVS